jgi:hypothetical protein
MTSNGAAAAALVSSAVHDCSTFARSVAGADEAIVQFRFHGQQRFECVDRSLHAADHRRWHLFNGRGD